MTSPYVTFNPPPAPPRPPARPVLKAMLAVLGVAGCTIGAFVAGVIAIIVWSGCFIECTGGDHRAGGALALLAVALLGAGPAAVAALYRSRVWLVVAGFAATAGAVLMVVAFSSN